MSFSWMFGILVSGWVQPPGTSSMCLVFAACTHSSLDRTMVRFTADTTGTAAGRLPALLVYLVHTKACLGGCTPHTHTDTHISHTCTYASLICRHTGIPPVHAIYTLSTYNLSDVIWRLTPGAPTKWKNTQTLTLHGKSVTKNRNEKNNNHNNE